MSLLDLGRAVRQPKTPPGQSGLAQDPEQSALPRMGAELVIHGDDLRHRCPVGVGHDRRSWRYDWCI